MSYSEIKNYLDENNVSLIAVSKTKPVEAIQEMYNLGQRDFGENRVQELTEKQHALPSDIRWHLIGQLQKNKVKYIADFVYMIHSVDSLSLAEKIDKEANKKQKVINILLQIKIAQEESKQGYHFDELLNDLPLLMALENLKICGIMGMGSLTDDEQQTEAEFESLKSYFDQLKSQHFSSDKNFKEISMGMSGDYEIAVRKGSTMVRIGSLLFGSR